MAEGTNKWLSKCDPQTWLLEEYKMLLAQYFHEDTQFKNIIKMFSTIHIALFAYATSNFMDSRPLTPVAISIVGILLSIAWFGSMVRVREFRDFFGDRINEVEEALHKAWKHDGFTPLDLRTSRRWKDPKEGENFIYQYFRGFKTGKMYLALPICSLAVWIVMIIWNLYWPA